MKKNYKRLITIIQDRKSNLKKLISYERKGKGYERSFYSWIDKKDLIKYVQFYRLQSHCIKMSQCFPKPHEPCEGDINVKVGLSNYATKTDIKIFCMLTL